MGQPSIYVHGPAGCGKTTNAEKIRQHFGLDRVVDDYAHYNRQDILSHGSLTLGNGKGPDGIRSIPYLQVAQDLKLGLNASMTRLVQSMEAK